MKSDTIHLSGKYIDLTNEMATLLTREIEADPLDAGDTAPHDGTRVSPRIGPITAPRGGIEATREIESAAIGMIVTNYTTMTAIEKTDIAEISIKRGAYNILRARDERRVVTLAVKALSINRTRGNRYLSGAGTSPNKHR